MKPPTLSQMKGIKRADTVPPGWFSRQDLENEWKTSLAYTNKLIKDALAAKRVTVQKFIVQTPTRGLYPTPHYKFH
jgi:hypothetical protein